MPLTCTYEGTPIKNGVRLIMPTGECVNDIINQLLTPGWKKENSDEGNRITNYEKVTTYLFLIAISYVIFLNTSHCYLNLSFNTISLM